MSNAKQREWRFYLDDMIDFAEKVLIYTDGLDQAGFVASGLTYDATLRNRGLRHAPGQDCLTVLDLDGQAHRRYRADTRLKALMPRHRFSIDREVELDFPHLPAGCSIQLDRLSRQHVLEYFRENFGRLTTPR